MRPWITAALVTVSTTVAAQDYAPNFHYQGFVFDPKSLLQKTYPPTPELSAITNHNTVDLLNNLNIDTKPKAIPVQPVQVQPISEPTPPKPEPMEQTTPERIPWPEPGYNCCWPQNIDGSLYVDPDSFGGGN